jgi:dipeptidyl aminopeptidase/acylaminoacyl peptidase
LKVEAQTGRAQPAENPEALKKALAALPSIGDAGVPQATAARRQFNPKRDAFFFSYANDLYHAALDGSSASRLTASPGVEETPLYSPDGKWIAFVREDNLYVVDVATRTERALTSDGGGVIRNGKADWVYWEEIWDRNARPFWWSPDSKRIAFLRFDDAHVPKFTIVNELPVHQKLEQTHYPKVGDPNPIVKLGVAPVSGGDVDWVNIPADADRAVIISRVGWRPTGDVYFTVQDRIQTQLDLYFCKPGASPEKILRQKNPKGWVEYNTEPMFLSDGSFVMPSEHTGFRHLYLHSPTGAPKATLTSGEWEVRRLVSIDEKTGFATFVGMKDDPIGEATYRVKLDGTGLEKTAAPVGARRRVSFSPNRRLFVESWSDHRTPPQVALFHASGPMVRRIDANPVHAQEKAQLSPMEFVKVPTKDGYTLEGYVVRPSKFDPAKKYPVWVTVYGGPRMPQVRRAFEGGRMMNRMLAETGMVVFCVDPRSASGKGAASAWTAYRQLGVQESKDLAEAVGWLVEKHPYCDAKRVGIEGTSYGGYMTAYCMTHTKVFAAGLAGAAVTDWHNYDSIYTERYMSTPADNPDGYTASSVVKAAANLSGKLLIVHGMMDDNVHPQNALQFVHELQKANKDFELMVYPVARHGGFGRHYAKLRTDFIKRALGGPSG